MKKLLAIILAMAAMTGCTEKKEENKDVIHFMGYSNVYDSGKIYSAGQEPNKTVNFIDFISLERAPLCAVPNCTHSMSSSECLAQIVGDYPRLIDDSIYFFRVNGAHGEGEMIETPDGPEFVMNSKLMKASLDSSETETVAEFTDAIPREDSCLLLGRELYFIAYDPDPYFDGLGGASWGNGGGYDFLCSINLDTGKYTNYGYFCYVEDEYPTANSSSGASLKGYYNGKIILQYSFLKEEIVCDEENIPVYFPPFTVYTYEFDPETKEFAESELPEPCYISGEYYVSQTQDSDDITVIKGDKRYIIEDFYYCNIIANNKVCYNAFEAGGMWCEIGENEVHIIGGEYEDYYIVAYHDGKYVLFNGRKAVKLTEEELIATSHIREETT